MFTMITAVFFYIFSLLSFVQATIYVITPNANSVCHGGQSCTVAWVDDGSAPLLSNIGPCHVGLYNGQDVLVQQISPVDVSATHTLTFTVDPKAGPSSNDYYVKFTSVNQVASQTVTEYSPNFRLDDMQGSFSSPVPSDTSSISVPSSVASAPPNSISTTIIITSSTSQPSSTPSVTPSSQPSSSSSESGSHSVSSTTSASSAPSSSSEAKSTPVSSSTVVSSSTSTTLSAPSLSATTLTVSGPNSFTTLRSSTLFSTLTIPAGATPSSSASGSGSGSAASSAFHTCSSSPMVLTIGVAILSILLTCRATFF